MGAGAALLAGTLIFDLLSGSPEYGTPGYWAQFAIALLGVLLAVIPLTAAEMADDRGGWDE